MKKLITIGLALFSFVLSIKGQEDTVRTLARLTLESGTVLTGAVRSENGKQVHLVDLHGQEYTVEKSTLKKWESISGETYCFIKTTDGSAFKGMFLGMTKDKIIIQSVELGRVPVLLSSITEINYVDSRNVVDGKVWFDNPHPTRYFYGPSAFQLKRGDGFYHNAMLLSNSVHYGVTDYFSIGGGALVPFFIYITPKFGFDLNEYVHLGGGVFAGTTLLGEFNVRFAASYGSLTLGTRDHNITVNAGYAFANGNPTEKLTYNFNGMLRVGRKVSLVTENWMFPMRKYSNYSSAEPTWNYNLFLSGGLRIFGEKNSFDLGVLLMTEQSMGLPYVAYAFKF